jgi:hypothetical protein
MFIVNASGLDKTLNKLSNLSANIKDDVQVAMNAFAINTTTDAKILIKSNGDDTGALANAMQYEIRDLRVVIYNSKNYSTFVEFGTKSYASKYVAVLPKDWQNYAQTFKGKKTGTFRDFIERMVVWGKKKGMTRNQSYYAAKKILKEGTKQKPYLYPSVQKNLLIFIKDVKNIFK